MRYFNTERLGVLATDKIVTKDIGWIFREQPICDVGIDAIIEQVENNNPKGKFIALQIKSGEGNFHVSKNKLTYYASNIHYDYWLNLNIPVLLIAHLPIKEETYWTVIDESTLKKTENKWKIELSTKSKFNVDSKQQLIQILAYQKKKRYDYYKTLFDDKIAQYNLFEDSIDDLYTDKNSHGDFRFLSKLNTKKLATKVARAVGKIKGERSEILIIHDNNMGEAIYSLTVEKDKNIYILINGNLNSCWRNFSIIRSLFEIYFNLGEISRTKEKEANYLAALEKAYEKNIELDVFFKNTVSIIVAPKDRKLVYEIGRTLIDDPNRPFTNYDLAKSYQVPEFIIKFYREKIEKTIF
ncbi:MAG: DUF4365 domain-containing protein [Bacteroidia bacterium]|nr:DUF4365 domain-containing protein [Bacteroidia bacterium]MBP7260955.1 DUF4365 domain-containing protein [Bacteroidia bacterium]MBP9180434.1 DUF4365 domain-containing protein [Bacteroidia bacterium]MBP9723581.1 DUF4365 domain-containing protein [Bacteroidia bacterium]